VYFVVPLFPDRFGAMAKRPNILLITTDTQRFDTINAMGYPHAKSPHLDRLAREGVVFTQGHTCSPVCCPARTSLMRGVIENGLSEASTHQPMMTDPLRDAGYVCVMSGKTHFGAIPDSFEINYAIGGSKHGDSDDLYKAHLDALGFERDQGFPHEVPPNDFYDGFVTTMAIRGMEEAIEQYPDRPFFAFCSMTSPHGPMDPPKPWDTHYALDELPPQPLNPTTENEPQHTQRLLGLEIRQKPMAEIDEKRRLYYGLASYCDDQVGRILSFLDERGLREDTLVIFTSDHGIDLYDHGFDNKHHYYDNTWRIPFIVSQPGTIEPGERAFANWTDLTATILATAGVEAPWVQGLDLYGPLVAGDDSPRKCAVATLYRSCALATSRWKLEYYFDDGSCRLFDRLNDPGEYTNLSESADHAEVKQAMTAALLEWRGSLLDVAHLQSQPPGGGPVARRLKTQYGELRGSDSEARVSERAVTIDDTFASL
jgi:arylsulfatase A-like enzyme